MNAHMPGMFQNGWRVDRAQMTRNLIFEDVVNFDTFWYKIKQIGKLQSFPASLAVKSSRRLCAMPDCRPTQLSTP
ncbi:hypothetical protein [Polaromonas sp.]|uniref:hypothetical protein n=1 Tax=Polaromonas sp. TaxID=1869339 RepID=UPI0013BBF494|nr:hypothetical protein [Polaromonas sp.]NDP64795.1 hypothetical protein [Polaromonas sp.]